MAKAAGPDELILEAMERALADPTPRKLHGTKANPGIFLSSSAAAKAAAQQCLQLGLIAACGQQQAKSKAVPLYGISPAGVGWLLQHDPLRQLLAATQDGVAQLAQTSTDCQQTLSHMHEQIAKLREVVQHAAARLQPPDVQAMLAAVQTAQAAGGSGTTHGHPAGVTDHADGQSPRSARGKVTGAAQSSAAAESAVSAAQGPELAHELLRHVQQHKRQTPLRPIDLPELFRFARSRQPALSLGQFHDLVRQLADAGRIRLSPFTQAMYQLPEPECAMMVGREIIYYVEGV